VKEKPRTRTAEGGAGSAQKARTPIESAVAKLYVVARVRRPHVSGTWTTVLRFTQDKQLFGMGRELTLSLPLMSR
jgi:hypothetical protein